MVALVGSWSNSLPRANAAGSYGIPTGVPAAASLQVSVANTGNPGNWMLAFVTWRLPAAFFSTVAVGDDAGNLWEPLGAPAGTSTAAGLTRSAIWYTVNPKPAANLYVSPNGYTGGILALVCEMSGLPPWATLTGIGTGYQAAATALSLSLPAPSAPAMVVTCLGGDLTGGTVGGPGGGWTSLGSVTGSNGVDHTSDTVLAAAFQVVSGAVTAAWTDTAANDLSGVLAGVLVTGAVPAAPSQLWPYTRLLAGFGAGAATPWDLITWTDLTARYRGMSGQRGKQYELDTVQAGTSNYTLSNNDGALTPGFQGGAFWQGVDGWQVTVGAGTLTPSQQYSWQGMACALYTPDGVTAGGKAETTLNPVTPGLSYTASLWALSPQGWGTVAAFISWYAAGGGYLSTSAGTAGALTAGDWAQFTVTAAAPAGAEYGTAGFIVQGTAPASTRFWIAAAMLQNPAGAVINANWNFSQGPQVFTPVRLLATWPPPPAQNAHTYPVARQFAERWPQQLTQSRYQVANTVGTDAWALLTPLLLTAAREEVLQDDPVALWPLDDAAGAQSARQIAPTGVTPLTVAASRNGTGTAAVTFGVSASELAGDPSASGWQQSNVPGAGGQGYCLYTADTGLPPIAGGVTIEGWFNFEASQPTVFSGTLISLRSPKGNIAEVFFEQSTGLLYVNVWDKITGNGTITNLSPVPVLNGLWNHVALLLSETSWQVIVNGGTTADMSGTANLASAPYWICFSGIADRFAGEWFWNGITSSVAVYSGLLPPNRVASHYWAYLTGLAGDDQPGARMERLLGDGMCALPRLIGQGGSTVVGALDVSGQAVSQNVANIAESDGGFLLVNGAGYIAYLQRASQYNLPVTFTLGEQVSVQLNANALFDAGTAPWTAGNGGVLAWASSFGYPLVYGTSYPYPAMAGWPWPTSLVLNGNGSTANPQAISELIPVTAGTVYTASAWLITPQGWADVQLIINWYTSGGSFISATTPAGVSLAAGVPDDDSTTGQAPPTAGYAKIVIQMTGTPAATVELFAYAALLATAYGEQPYLADVAFDFDNSQVFNDLTLSQLASPSVVQYQFAATTSGSLFIASGIGNGFQFTAGQMVVLSGGSLPAPFTAGATYYVVNVTGPTFQLAATSGGSAITVTGNGTGYVTGIIPAAGVTVALASQASIAAYGDQTLQQTVYLTDPNVIADQASWIINTLGVPAIRVSQITLDPAANPALWPVALGAETGQVYTVNHRLGSGTENPPEISEQVQVMSVAHNNQPGSWRTVLGLVPYYGQALTLDDPVRGVLDGANRIAW